jgi:hypothetical protein
MGVSPAATICGAAYPGCDSNPITLNQNPGTYDYILMATVVLQSSASDINISFTTQCTINGASFADKVNYTTPSASAGQSWSITIIGALINSPGGGAPYAECINTGTGTVTMQSATITAMQLGSVVQQ